MVKIRNGCYFNHKPNYMMLLIFGRYSSVMAEMGNIYKGFYKVTAFFPKH